MRVLPVVVGLAVLAASGCAGDPAPYVDEANAICARVVAEGRALYVSTGPARRARDQAFARIVSRRAAALEDLHDVSPPSEQRRDYDRMLRHFDSSQRLLRQAERSWGRSEEAPFLLVAASREGDKGHVIARDLGLRDCADF